MKRIIALMLVVLVCGSFVACTKIENEPNISPSENPRVEVLHENNYGTSLVDKLYAKENVIISDLSIRMALSMALEGAEGETKEQLETYLGFSQEEAKELNSKIISYVKNLESDEYAPITVEIGNAYYYQNPAKSGYLDILQKFYNADTKEVDFSQENTTDEINGFVKDRTHGLIEKIAEYEDLKNLSDFLVNVLYFKGAWVDEFYTTEKETFTGLNHGLSIDMMSSVEDTYFENDKAIAFSKPYFGGYEFIGILPNEDEFNLDDLDFKSLLASRTDKYDVEIKLPKLNIDYGTTLDDSLKALGMTVPFDPEKADFSKINDNKFISSIIHKTKIIVDEKGTEAAAATGIAMTASAMPQPKEIKQVFLNKPFAFLIYDRENDIALFTGKIVDLNE